MLGGISFRSVCRSNSTLCLSPRLHHLQLSHVAHADTTHLNWNLGNHWSTKHLCRLLHTDLSEDLALGLYLKMALYCGLTMNPVPNTGQESLKSVQIDSVKGMVFSHWYHAIISGRTINTWFWTGFQSAPSCWVLTYSNHQPFHLPQQLKRLQI